MGIGPRWSSVGDRPHRVTLQAPGPPVPDGDGGFTESWTDLTPPQVYAKIVPATVTALEQNAAGTVISTATHLIAIPYQPGITTLCRVVYGSRAFQVAGFANRDEVNVDLVLFCKEVVQ